MPHSFQVALPRTDEKREVGPCNSLRQPDGVVHAAGPKRSILAIWRLMGASAAQKPDDGDGGSFGEGQRSGVAQRAGIMGDSAHACLRRTWWLVIDIREFGRSPLGPWLPWRVPCHDVGICVGDEILAGANMECTVSEPPCSRYLTTVPSVAVLWRTVALAVLGSSWRRGRAESRSGGRHGDSGSAGGNGAGALQLLELCWSSAVATEHVFWVPTKGIHTSIWNPSLFSLPSLRTEPRSSTQLSSAQLSTAQLSSTLPAVPPRTRIPSSSLAFITSACSLPSIVNNNIIIIVGVIHHGPAGRFLCYPCVMVSRCIATLASHPL